MTLSGAWAGLKSNFSVFLPSINLTGADTTSYHPKHPPAHETLSEAISLCSVQKVLALILTVSHGSFRFGEASSPLVV